MDRPRLRRAGRRGGGTRDRGKPAPPPRAKTRSVALTVVPPADWRSVAVSVVPRTPPATNLVPMRVASFPVRARLTASGARDAEWLAGLTEARRPAPVGWVA